MKKGDTMIDNLEIKKLAPTDERVLEVINFLSEESFNLFIQNNLKEFDNLEHDKKDKFKELALRQGIDYYLSCDGEIYVAYLNDAIIGAALRNNDSLDSLFVKKEYRNQKVGGTLLEKVLNDCKEYQVIRLNANIKAISLYQRYGFCQNGQIEKNLIVPMVLERKKYGQ